MKILPEPVSFDWNKGNIDKNLKKHGVSNKEAEQVFSNKPLLLSLDKKHSTKTEIRYQALGKTDEDKILFLSFTVREQSIRIISARSASRKERDKYAKKQKV